MPKARSEPFSRSELIANATTTGQITGVVRFTIDEMVEGNFEGFLDRCSLRLTGSTLLEDVDYRLVGVEDGVALIQVTGDIREVLESEPEVVEQACH